MLTEKKKINPISLSIRIQRNSYRSHTNVKYNKLSKGKRSSSGSGTTTLAIPSGDDDGDMEPMMASTLNFSDDEDDEQNGNEITFYANTWERGTERERERERVCVELK